jgi:two-component system, LytTR family, sensor kinase
MIKLLLQYGTNRRALHVGFWFVVAALLATPLFNSKNEAHFLSILAPNGLLFIGFIGLTYFNFSVLIQRLLFADKPVYYVLAYLAINIFVGLFLDWLVFTFIFRGISNDLLNSGSLFIFFGLIPIGIKLIRKDIHNKLVIKDLEHLRTQAELQTLKSQVNPHFLFNTLNSVYALALDASPNTPDVVLKLSELMRYMFTTAQQERVSLTDEIRYLENYMQLEKLRLSDEAVVVFNCSLQNSMAQIAPMLLLPFVENAFKHGLENHKGQLNVQVEAALQGRALFFEVRNSRPQVTTPSETTGTGLDNVRKRLAILYPNQHELSIETTEHTFKINLWIQL